MSIPALRDLDNLTLARTTQATAREAVCGDDSRLRTPFALNYIKNPDAEVDTTGWAAYADTAGPQPVGGSGGSPTVSITQSTTNLLRGSALFAVARDAANRQGQGVSYLFNIDYADKNKTLTASFDFAIQSGTYTAGDLSVWVIDTGAGKCVPISGGNLIVAAGRVTVHFTTTGNTQYRLCIHVGATTTASWTVQMDDFYVGPVYLPSSPAMSDWQAYTPTTQGLGTVTAVSAAWRRVGDTCEVQVRLTPGTTTAVLGYVGLPDGLTIDTKLGSGVAQIVGVLGNNSVANIVSVLAVSGRSYLTFGLWNSAGRNALTEVDGNVPFGSGVQQSFFARVPIAGWSGSTAVQPGSRYLWAQKFAANAVRVTTTPSKPGEYRAWRLGTDTAPTTAPTVADGFRGDSGSGVAAGRCDRYEIYVGPGKVVSAQGYESAGRTGHLCIDLFTNGILIGAAVSYDPVVGTVSVKFPTLAAGDCAGVTDTFTTPATAYFDILVADDPVPVALAPAVHVDATTTSGQVITASVTDIIWGTKSVDTHGAMNTSTGVFTAPVPGKYLITESHRFGATAGAVPLIYKGGAFQMSGSIAGGAGQTGNVAGCLQLSAGDTITIRDGGTAGVALSTTANVCRIQITRVSD
jgi:hypothetical protein